MKRWLTIPNVICMARAACSPLLLVFAWNGYAKSTLALFLILSLSDFVDGKLARWLDQRSEIGPRLDSFSDALMYGCLALSMVFLRGDALSDEFAWITVALSSYVAASLFALVKFGGLPSYHTRSAKTAWLFVAVAAATFLIGGPAWPIRLAMTTVTLANLESCCITYKLQRPISDLPSIFHLPTDSTNRHSNMQ